MLGASCFEEPKRHNLHHVVKHLSFRCLHSPLATIVSAFAMIPWVGAWFVSPFSVVVVNKVGVFLIKSFLPACFYDGISVSVLPDTDGFFCKLSGSQTVAHVPHLAGIHQERQTYINGLLYHLHPFVSPDPPPTHTEADYPARGGRVTVHAIRYHGHRNP